MLKIAKEKKDLLLNINKKTIEKNDKNNILPTYKKHSRNLIIHNPIELIQRFMMTVIFIIVVAFFVIKNLRNRPKSK